jgi:zinc protease
MNRLLKSALFLALVLTAGAPLLHAQRTNDIAVLLRPSKSPLVSFRIVFLTGSAYDPVGKEGVASLTAALVAEGGSQRLAYEEIIKRMYPMATSFGWQVDKEMTVFTGSTHVDNLQRYYNLIREMVLSPGFRDEDFRRLKTDALNFLKVSLRQGNDEELGKEALYNEIYRDHPYGHHNHGTIKALEQLAIDDVKQFYRSNYSQGKVVLGVAGGFPEDFGAQLQRDFALLPAGPKAFQEFTTPKLEPGMRISIIQRDTRSTAISMGFPIEVNRAHRDHAALKLVESYFGQHRSSNSHLYQRLREARGLNYGDYAYIEYFPRGMYQFQPDPNLGRQEQIFQIWIRPVPPEQALFTLRAALYEYDRLVSDGLSQEAFESTREFLTKFVDVLLQTQSDGLGYALDSSFYSIPEYGEYLKKELAKLTVEQVNEAIKRHLQSNKMRVIIVTKEAESLKDSILSAKPSPITYNSPKAEEITAEDKTIEKYPIPTKAEWVKIIPVTQIFE